MRQQSHCLAEKTTKKINNCDTNDALVWMCSVPSLVLRVQRTFMLNLAELPVEQGCQTDSTKGLWLQVVVPTKQQHTRRNSFNQLIWVFRPLTGQTVSAWLVGTKTCSHRPFVESMCWKVESSVYHPVPSWTNKQACTQVTCARFSALATRK